jgi:hypothetical protein
MKMNKTFLIIILMVLNSINAFNQSINGTISNPAYGYEFTVPQGWQGQQIENGYLFMSNTQKGFILILQHSLTTLDQIKNEANNGIIDDNGTHLILDGSLKKLGQNGLAAPFNGTVEWQQAKAYVISILSHFNNGGLTILTAVEPQSYNQQYQKLVEQIANSVKFEGPKSTSLALQWKNTLNDCRLTYMNSYNSGYGGGGYQDKTIIDLCSKGYFNFNDHSETVINAGNNAGGYLTGSSAGSGKWNLIGRGNQVILQLIFNSGETYEYTLSEKDGKTFLNGNRYFKTYGNSSVESGRPNCW